MKYKFELLGQPDLESRKILMEHDKNHDLWDIKNNFETTLENIVNSDIQTGYHELAEKLAKIQIQMHRLSLKAPYLEDEIIKAYHRHVKEIFEVPAYFAGAKVDDVVWSVRFGNGIIRSRITNNNAKIVFDVCFDCIASHLYTTDGFYGLYQDLYFHNDPQVKIIKESLRIKE